MTSGPNTPPSRESLREQAAQWFAALRAPDGDARRDEFQAWLACGPEHRAAYNRIAETFALGRDLKNREGRQLQRVAAAQIRKQGRSAAVLAAAIGIVAVLGFTIIGARIRPESAPGNSITAQDGETLRLTTRIGEIRSFVLSDGSTATLDTGSVVVASLDGDRRQMLLLKGRARFSVAHEQRPFVVAAGRGSVTARGTIFDVALIGVGKIRVRLLKGAVDVRVVGDDGKSKRRLSPGETATYGENGDLTTSRGAVEADANWPVAMRDFNGARLADVLADANRYAQKPLRAGSSDIADLRIAGTFRMDNIPNLIANLADVLRLSRIVGADEVVLVWECPASSKENCTPPS